MAPNDDRLDRRVAAAKWLRETREARGYSTAGAFARALGIERYQLSNWETGRSAIGDDDAARIAETLGMPEIQVRRGLGLWVPREPDTEADLPSPGDFEAIVTQLPDGSEVSYAIRRDRLARMGSDDLRRLAQEMIEHVMEIERQRGTQGQSDT